jgi:hypothetical protein
VTVEVRQRDITRLGAGDLAGADLITCSALLDMLTAAEVERVAAACAGVGCPTLLTLSVVGRVGLDPADPLDARSPRRSTPTSAARWADVTCWAGRRGRHRRGVRPPGLRGDAASQPLAARPGPGGTRRAVVRRLARRGGRTGP